ncbi:MAG: hypothetical protein ACLGGX_05490 [Bdellovibrionia bacterium]
MNLIKNIFLFFILLNSVAQAKVFRNNYISFEMPDSWRCNLEQTEWVCRSQNNNESREAIIILTAKEVGPTDSFPQYESHLNTPMTVNLKSGGVATSAVQYKAKNIQINNQAWIDSLHLGSEVPNYYTRYVATIKEQIAILVTFSAHKDFYTKYSADFFKSIQSLQVIASKNLLARPDMGTMRPGSETLGSAIGSAMPADMMGAELVKKKKGSNTPLIIALMLIAAGIAWFIYKRKK